MLLQLTYMHADYLLRPWEETDLSSLVKHANNIKIARYLTNKFPHPYTEASGRSFIAYANSSPGIIMAIEVEGEACGGIGIHLQDDVYVKNAELGYWLGETYWNRGIISRAIREITTLAFSSLEIDRIYARPFGTNLSSQRVLQKVGYTLEARLEKTFYKHDQYEDEFIYAMRRPAWEG